MIDLHAFSDYSLSIAVLHERSSNLGRYIIYIDHCINSVDTVWMVANVLINVHLHVSSIFETYELGLHYMYTSCHFGLSTACI